MEETVKEITVQNLLERNKELDKKKQEIKQIVGMLWGFLKYVGFNGQEEIKSTKGRWTIGQEYDRTNQGVVRNISCFPVNMIGAMPPFCMNSKGDYEFETNSIDDVRDQLQELIDGMLKKFPGSKGQVERFLK